MSELITSLSNNMTRGITLNYQHIDLFLILDDKSKSDEIKKTEIIEYLKKCEESQKAERNALNLASAYTDYTADKLGIEDTNKLKNVILQDISSVFDRNALIKAFEENGYQNPEELNDTFMEATDNVMNRTKEGITAFLVYDNEGKIDIDRTFKKVEAFYSHVISGEYNRINFDDIASPSSYMAIQSDFVRPKKLEKALEFCDNHNLSSKINSAFFYMHSQYPESPVINTKDDLIRYYETYFNSIGYLNDETILLSYYFQESLNENESKEYKDIYFILEIKELLKNNLEKIENMDKRKSGKIEYPKSSYANIFHAKINEKIYTNQTSEYIEVEVIYEVLESIQSKEKIVF